MYKQHDFYSNFNNITKSNDSVLKRDLILHELADIIVNHRRDLLTVYGKSGIRMPQDATDEQLVNAFLQNYDRNKNLVIGISYLIAHKNKSFSGADGEGGGKGAGTVGAIASAVGLLAGATQQGLANRGQKQQAKADLMQTIINKRNPQAPPAPRKKDNTLIIVGVTVTVLALAGLVYWKYNQNLKPVLKSV